MKRVVLLYNPVSGRRPQQRRAIIETVATALQHRGCDITITPTEAPGSASQQAAEACAAGADIVFACGGDGTIHEVLQGMVFHPHAALGILPLGSANALARHLRLSLDPVKAVLLQIAREPRVVPVGLVTYQTPQGESSRYFTVMAGAGPDGALVYRMLAAGKHRFGRLMYYLRAAKLFLGSHFSSFSLTFTQADHSAVSFQAVSAMALRVGDLGGLFSPLARGASVDHAGLLLLATTPPARLSLAAWFAMGWTRLGRFNPYLRTLQVEGFQCGDGEGAPVQVQADGEWLGRTPMSVKLVPNALRLLMRPDNDT